jgi:hypothetical protein
MHVLLLAAVLAGSGDATPVVGFESLPAAAEHLAPQFQTGSLIFSKGDCLAVKVFTVSPYTHVAAAVVHDGKCNVYDSTSGVGVRRLTLEEYLLTQSPDEIHVFHPRRPLTPQQAEDFECYLESRVGTPYAITHHLTGERAEGIHCSEYVTDALMCIEVVRAERPSKVSPASLVAGITQHEIYSDGETYVLAAEPIPEPQGSNWCEQLWIDTKLCCASCCDKLTGWFLCR